MSTVRIVLFTRYPTPGDAKTRLIPALGAEGAAALHRRLTELTLVEVRVSGLKFEVRGTGAGCSAFKAWLGALPVADQGEGDLGERLERAGPPYPTIFIGTDAPDLRAAHLLDAAASVAAGRTVLGPAADGGYWLLGLPHALPRLFEAMPWGSDRVLGETMSRLSAAGVVPAMLGMLHDLDRPEDLARWPHLA